MSNNMTEEQRGKLSGFTLIELLVVIMIVSVIASFAALSIHMNKSKQIETAANQLVNLLNLAQQEALLNSTTLGFAITKDSFQFYSYSKNNTWKALSDPILGFRRFPNGINITLKTPNKETPKASPQIIISPSGETTPFTLYISKEGASPLYKVRGEANGNIKSENIRATD